VTRAPLAIYLSSPTALEAELATYAAELRAMGFRVVSRWLGAVGQLEAAAAAKRDIDDLRTADVLVAFTGRGGRGGRHVELGIALERNLPVVIVGPIEHVFHQHPLVTVVESWADAVQRLRALATLGGTSIGRPSA
jgi:hypothetical protein